MRKFLLSIFLLGLIGLISLALWPLSARAQEPVNQTLILCQQGDLVCLFLSSVFGPQPTATPTKTPTPGPTFTPTATPTPTPIPTPWEVRDVGDSVNAQCPQWCYQVSFREITCRNLIIDMTRSTYEGKPFNSFSDGVYIAPHEMATWLILSLTREQFTRHSENFSTPQDYVVVGLCFD